MQLIHLYTLKIERKSRAKEKGRQEFGLNNVVLIGMPGAGKSTIGVVLAKMLGYQFMDSDLLIQTKENRKLSEIIEQEGIEGFIDIENRVNSQIETKKHVIATGGSVVYGEEAMEHLRSIGTVVYLHIGCEELSKRLGDLTCRGVVIKKGQGLADLYKERCPLYEKYAHITVDCEGLSIEKLAQKIKSSLQM